MDDDIFSGPGSVCARNPLFDTPRHPRGRRQTATTSATSTTTTTTTPSPTTAAGISDTNHGPQNSHHTQGLSPSRAGVVPGSATAGPGSPGTTASEGKQLLGAGVSDTKAQQRTAATTAAVTATAAALDHSTHSLDDHNHPGHPPHTSTTKQPMSDDDGGDGGDGGGGEPPRRRWGSRGGADGGDSDDTGRRSDDGEEYSESVADSASLNTSLAAASLQSTPSASTSGSTSTAGVAPAPATNPVDPRSYALDPQRKYVKEDFEFFRQLGEGSYARVVLAISKETGEEYAAKIVDKKLVLRENKVEAIKNERRVLMMLKHPNVVELLCTFTDEDSLYFILELAKEGELFSYISENGPTRPEVAAFYTAEIINALEYCHSKGVIHRDLKPENVLLADTWHVKLTDFGTAKVLDNPGGHSNTFCGTAEYVSPEVLQGAPSSASSDLWALGCVLYQLLAGHPPFQAASEYLIFQKVLKAEFSFPESFPPDAKDLVLSLMQRDPAKRIGVAAGGYAALKRHPFFAGIDFSTLHLQTPPKLVPDIQSPMSSMMMNHPNSDSFHGSGGDPQRSGFGAGGLGVGADGDDPSKHLGNNQWQMFLLPTEKVMYSTCCFKKRKLSNKKRQLILTDFPRLFYVDSVKMENKGEIPWVGDMTIAVKDMKNRHFVISVPGRDYLLEDTENTADKWCDAVRKQMAIYKQSKQLLQKA